MLMHLAWYKYGINTASACLMITVKNDLVKNR